MFKKIVLFSYLTLLLSCNPAPTLSTDDMFVGKWVYFKTIPYPTTDDHTQDGMISSLTKVDNTSESYSFAIYTGQTIVFTKQNDSTLTGVGNNMKLIYISSTKHIALVINSTDGIEFSRLK